MQGFLRMDLSDQSLAYLDRISGGAPMDYIKRPAVYLSNPKLLFNADAIQQAGVLGLTTSFTFLEAKSFLSSSTSIPEFVVLGQPDSVLANWYPKHVGEFRPYFVWAQDVNRSQSARRFAVSMANTMAMDHVMFTGTIQWEPDQGAMSLVYNHFTQGVRSNPY